MTPLLYDLIAKVLSGAATPEEAASLHDTCAKDSAAREAYEEAKAIWAQADKVMPAFTVNKTAAWAKIQAALGAEAAQPGTVSQPRRIALIPRWTRWAAAAVVVGLGLTLLLRQAPATETVVAAGTGQTVGLPDGSTVTLQKGARLQYARRFEQKGSRQVALTGKAFFEVAHDPQHPFTVSADGLEITVVGTSFLVDAAEKEVSVRTGKVKVAEGRKGKTVLLAAGEEATLKDDSFQKEQADSNDYFLKTGKIAFNNEPFEKIIGDISRILAMPVQLDASISPAGRAQTVTYSSSVEALEPVLTDLCRITGYQWRKDDGGVYHVFRAR